MSVCHLASTLCVQEQTYARADSHGMRSLCNHLLPMWTVVVVVVVVCKRNERHQTPTGGSRRCCQFSSPEQPGKENKLAAGRRENPARRSRSDAEDVAAAAL